MNSNLCFGILIYYSKIQHLPHRLSDMGAQEIFRNELLPIMDVSRLVVDDALVFEEMKK